MRDAAADRCARLRRIGRIRRRNCDDRDGAAVGQRCRCGTVVADTRLLRNAGNRGRGIGNCGRADGGRLRIGLDRDRAGIGEQNSGVAAGRIGVLRDRTRHLRVGVGGNGCIARNRVRSRGQADRAGRGIGQRDRCVARQQQAGVIGIGILVDGAGVVRTGARPTIAVGKRRRGHAERPAVGQDGGRVAAAIGSRALVDRVINRRRSIGVIARSGVGRGNRGDVDRPGVGQRCRGIATAGRAGILFDRRRVAGIGVGVIGPNRGDRAGVGNNAERAGRANPEGRARVAGSGRISRLADAIIIIGVSRRVRAIGRSDRGQADRPGSGQADGRIAVAAGLSILADRRRLIGVGKGIGVGDCEGGGRDVDVAVVDEQRTGIAIGRIGILVDAIIGIAVSVGITGDRIGGRARRNGDRAGWAVGQVGGRITAVRSAARLRRRDLADSGADRSLGISARAPRRACGGDDVDRAAVGKRRAGIAATVGFGRLEHAERDRGRC